MVNSDFTCPACTTANSGRASCMVCATESPTATAESLAATAVQDAGAARAAQREEAARGNHDLAASLGRVSDAHLDDALALRHLGTH